MILSELKLNIFLDLSSAHVYLRLPRGETFESVPEEVVEECASLVKANSIKV